MSSVEMKAAAVDLLLTENHSLEDLFRLVPELKETIRRNYPASYDDFLHFIHLDLQRAIDELIADRHLHQTSGEDLLSSVLIAYLRNDYRTVLHDPQDGGHCDIYVTQKGKDNSVFKWIAEAKIWKGIAYGNKGLTQLLESYSTGTSNRDHGAMIFYFLSPVSVPEKMKEWKQEMMSKSLDGECEQIDDRGLIYSSRHPLLNGLNLSVRHYGVPLYHKPKADIATRS